MGWREEQETIERFERAGISYAEYLRGVTPSGVYGTAKALPASLPPDDTATMSPGYGWIAARGD